MLWFGGCGDCWGNLDLLELGMCICEGIFRIGQSRENWGGGLRGFGDVFAAAL